MFINSQPCDLWATTIHCVLGWYIIIAYSIPLFVWVLQRGGIGVQVCLMETNSMNKVGSNIAIYAIISVCLRVKTYYIVFCVRVLIVSALCVGQKSML